MQSEPGEARRGYRVTGRVQGVGFRWWTRRTAQQLGLGGSVRNMPDGSVQVQVVGPAERVDRLERALHDGPVGAHVSAVQTIPADPAASSADFLIAH